MGGPHTAEPCHLEAVAPAHPSLLLLIVYLVHNLGEASWPREGLEQTKGHKDPSPLGGVWPAPRGCHLLTGELLWGSVQAEPRVRGPAAPGQPCTWRLRPPARRAGFELWETLGVPVLLVPLAGGCPRTQGHLWNGAQMERGPEVPAARLTEPLPLRGAVLGSWLVAGRGWPGGRRGVGGGLSPSVLPKPAEGGQAGVSARRGATCLLAPGPGLQPGDHGEPDQVPVPGRTSGLHAPPIPTVTQVPARAAVLGQSSSSRSQKPRASRESIQVPRKWTAPIPGLQKCSQQRPADAGPGPAGAWASGERRLPRGCCPSW